MTHVAMTYDHVRRYEDVVTEPRGWVFESPDHILDVSRLHGVVVNYSLERPFDNGTAKLCTICVAVAHDCVHPIGQHRAPSASACAITAPAAENSTIVPCSDEVPNGGRALQA